MRGHNRETHYYNICEKYRRIPALRLCRLLHFSGGKPLTLELYHGLQ